MALEQIRLSRSDISQREIDSVTEALQVGSLGMGANVGEFEQRLGEFFGRESVCVSSGTAALQLALESLKLKSSDEVIAPDLTYVASIQAITASGAKPILCDVENKTFGLCYSAVLKKISKNTKAIMIVHYAGIIAKDYQRICAFAKQNNIRIIEDAAHAFGTKVDGELIGSFGDIVCFSFDGIKNITCGEGGCVVSSDSTVLKSVKDGRLLGVQNDTEKRLLGERSFKFNVKRQGWRYHMQNTNAAIGMEQLKRLDTFRLKKYQLWCNYHEQISNIHAVKVVLPEPNIEVIPHIYPVIFEDIEVKKKFQDLLNENNIQHGLHYQPNSSLDYFKQSPDETPISYQYFNKAVTLPFHTLLTQAEQNSILKFLKTL
jgi:dTDP-4-amino-4,6-dideoxygalactose transaminase